MKKIKVGVIGLGTIGSVHADAYKANAAGSELTAVCDIDAARLEEKGKALGVEGRYVDYRDLLKSDVDAVSVCVWNNLHKDIAVAAFKAGKHVLLEKPMALNAREAAQIVAAGKASGKILQVGMVRRQFSDVQVVRDMIDKGEFGDIYHMRAIMIRRRGIPGLGGWFTTKSRSGGGPIIDLAVHWFDAAMYISGHWNPTSVSAMTYAKFGKNMKNYRYVDMWAGPPKYEGVCDVEDYAAGFVRFGAKATMSFEIAWACNLEETSYIDIMGTQAGVRVFDGKPLTILTEQGGRITNVLPQYRDRGNTFHLQATAFLAAIRGECPPAATGEQGLINMKLIDAVYKSSQTGKEVAIK